MLGEILDRFTEVVDDLVGFDPTVLTDPAVEVAIQRVVEQARRVPAARGALVLEAVRRGLPGVHRHRSAGTYLRELVRCSAGDGNAWARQAEALAPRQPVSGGDPLPAGAPETAAAVSDGAIGDRHVGLILGTIARFPASVDPEAAGRVGGVAGPAGPDPRPGRVGPGVQAGAGRGRPRRHVRRTGDPAPPRLHDRPARPGRDDPGPRQPHPGGGRDGPLRTGPAGRPQSTEGCPDTRLAAQRYHDALAELARRALANGGLPVRHGHHATMLVTSASKTSRARTGLATVAHGGHLHVRDLLRHAADTNVIPVVLDSDGVVLHYGEESASPRSTNAAP